MAEPCRCDWPNKDCRRAGAPMVGKLFDYCKGLNCTAELSDAYRAKWDATNREVRTLGCIHLGVITDRTDETGKPCNCPKRWRRACAIHGTTTLNNCKSCGQFTADQEEDGIMHACKHARKDMTTAEMVDLIRHAPPGPWPDGWAGWPCVIDAHKQLLAERVASLPEYPGGHEGRGIVIAAGGPTYFTCAWVLAKVLRKVGCRLPIQFWHLGPLELDPGMARMVAEFGVECIDQRAVEKRDPMRILAGWETKIHAVMNCPFREVLFLDADNVPVNDPEYLFEDPRYRDKGALFWPDLPPHDRKEWVPRTAWENLSLTYRPKVVDFESGQLLVDKAKWWQELVCTRWLNEHSDWAFRFVFGDKSCWALGAWLAAEAAGNKGNDLPYAITSKPAGWVAGGRAGAILQHDLDGQLIFQHRCRPYGNPAKWAACDSKTDRIPGFVHEDACFTALGELRERWKGALWHNYEPTDEEKAAAALLVGKRWLYNRVGHDTRVLHFKGGSGAGGRIGDGHAECEKRWEVFIAGGETLLAICADGKPTCILARRDDGVWAGAWLEHERMPIELGEVTTEVL